MRKVPRPIRRTVQSCLRKMMNNKVSRPMALAIQGNLRQREETPLLQMVRRYKTTEVISLLAVTQALKV